MARLSTTSELKVEELPKDLQGPISNTFEILNYFMRQVAQVLNGQLSTGDNFLGFEHEFIARTSQFPVKFQNQLKVKPKHVICTRAVRLNSGTQEELEAAATVIAWRLDNQGQIEISSPTGLTSGELYKFTILVLG